MESDAANRRGEFPWTIMQRLTESERLLLYGWSTERNIEHAVGWRVNANQGMRAELSPEPTRRQHQGLNALGDAGLCSGVG